MSLGVVIKGPEGLVLAADSRVTLQASHGNRPAMVVNFDNATKLLGFSKPNLFVGAVTYGAAVIGQRTAYSFVPEFEVKLLEGPRLRIEDFSRKLSEFFKEQWDKAMPKDYVGPNMTFIVGGYDEGDAYGKVFLFHIPASPDPQAQNPDSFGMTWGGQLQIASRLIHGYDPALLGILQERLKLDEQQINELVKVFKENLEFMTPYPILPLQDCVDLALHLIRTTMTAQALALGIRGVGGPIDVAVITRTGGLDYIQQKKIQGERRY